LLPSTHFSFFVPFFFLHSLCEYFFAALFSGVWAGLFVGVFVGLVAVVILAIAALATSKLLSFSNQILFLLSCHSSLLQARETAAVAVLVTVVLVAIVVTIVVVAMVVTIILVGSGIVIAITTIQATEIAVRRFLPFFSPSLFIFIPSFSSFPSVHLLFSSLSLHRLLLHMLLPFLSSRSPSHRKRSS
jgi:hypothetical protein